MVSLQTVPSTGQKVPTFKLGRIEEKRPFTLVGQKIKISQLITQLLSNSLKEVPSFPQILSK